MTVTDNPSIKTNINKIENRITFKIKTGYYLELLTLETMKSSIKSKKPKDKSGENVLHLAITKVVIIYFNFVNNDYSQDFRVLYTFIHNKPFGQFLDISSKNCTFLKL